MMELIDYLISAICLFGIGMAFIRLYFVIKEYRSSSVANGKLGLALGEEKK